MRIIILVLILTLLCISALFLFSNITHENKKAEQTIQYSASIGPTQEEPYQLKSGLIGGNE